VPWSSYDGRHIRLTPSKSVTRKKPKGRAVAIPVSQRLKSVIETLPRVSPIMLTNGRGRPWRGNSFRKAWGAATTKAGLTGLTFHDLRGTAVTRLSEADCTPQEIATYTGWSLRDVQTMLDRYLARTEKLGSIALAKLERIRR
jgi:integrase